MAECGVCGQLRGVTLELNKRDYWAESGGRVVVDGVQQEMPWD